MATTITSPQDDYTGDSVFIDGTVLHFVDGKAEHDGEISDAIRGYLRGAGFGIDSDAAELEAPPDPPDPRTVQSGVVGTPLRDAAVDPQPDDFLPPVNAGKEGPEGNPHGSNVVAPEIHAAGDQAVVPGPVGKYVEVDAPTANIDGQPLEGKLGVVEPDTDLQQERESEFAERALVGNEPVPQVVADMGGVPDSLTPAGVLTGKRLDDALRDADLSTKGTAEEKRARLAEHQREQAEENPDDIPGAQSTADQAAAEGLEGDADDQKAAAEKLGG